LKGKRKNVEWTVNISCLALLDSLGMLPLDSETAKLYANTTEVGVAVGGSAGRILRGNKVFLF
jgi:hypothetical protein